MVSIIVPVFNAEKYLDECLHSIEIQTYKDFEVVIVDDGSTDGSGKICDKYSDKDKRFRVIHNSNHGVCYSRNDALKKITGDYVSFIDSDDKFDRDFLETMIGCMERFDCDIACCDYYNERGRENPNWKSGEIIREEVLSFYLKGYFCNRIMNKVYRTELIRGEMFPEDRPILEDADWTARILQKCNSVYLLSEGKYYYRIVNSSLSHRKMTKNEETGSFRNEINKLLVISKCLKEEDKSLFMQKVKDKVPWILLSQADLSAHDAYRKLRELICGESITTENNILFTIIREEHDYKKAQNRYFNYVMLHSEASFRERVKYLYRKLFYR